MQQDTPKYKIVNSTADMADSLSEIQEACFPYLAADEHITPAHFKAQIDVFPEGQHAAVEIATGRVVGSSTDMRCHIDFDHYQHSYMEMCGENWLTTHEPEGDWLYGVDIGVHPDFRRQGVSTLLYQARHDLVRRLNLKGHIAGGFPVGYGAMKDEMGIEEYLDKVVAGEIFDPTLSIQLKRGFKIHGVLYDYADDTSCDNKAALIVWRNPDYKA